MSGPSSEAAPVGETIEGGEFRVTRESIRQFCDASLDYNPLHLDDEYMKGSFGKTSFGGVIMHGMTNFGILSAMLTDWAHAQGGTHRRLETRWLRPVAPGDRIRPVGHILHITDSERARWVQVGVEVLTSSNVQVATGEALIELPLETPDAQPAA